MDIDIGFWLTVAVAVTLLVWLVDWALRRRQVEMPVKLREAFDFSNSLVPVLVVVLVVRSFLFEPFTIPSGSMLPTLQVHDFVLVNKFTYGLRLPVTNKLILEVGEPERGDVMVFRYPRNPSKNYIKRVVGLPGDRIEIRGTSLYLNDRLVPQQLVDEQLVSEEVRVGRHGRSMMLEVPYQRWTYVEDLAGTLHYMQRQALATGEAEPEIRTEFDSWEVPAGHYFVMGDNRDNSEDSRVWGFVPDSHIVGKATLIWMHWESLFSLPSFSRNGVLDKVETEQ